MRYESNSLFSHVEVSLFSPLFSAQELELEDTQSQLQQDLRRKMAVEGTALSTQRCSLI